MCFRRLGFKITSKRLFKIEELINDINASPELLKSILNAMLSLCCHRVYDLILLLRLLNVVKALFYLVMYDLCFHLISCVHIKNVFCLINC